MKSGYWLFCWIFSIGMTVFSQPMDGNKVLVAELSDSVAVEYAPSISADGKTMIFESNKSGGYKLFESVKNENGRWTTPVPIVPINSFADSSDLIGGPSLSFDGNTLYFFASIGFGSSSDIYISVRTRTGWSVPEKVGPPINTDGYDAFPSISADGKTLYFVRINEEGPTNRDLRRRDIFCTSIFKSEKDENGEWKEPIKLPAPINVDCEKAPRIMADGKTLIFSSNRPGGRGDYDMYQSTQNVIGEWIGAVPLDYVNTNKSDQLPSISASGDLMYFVYDNQDIYKVKIPEDLRQFMNNVISGTVTDRDTGEGISARIVVNNALTSEKILSLDNNPENGAFSVVLPVGKSYNLQVVKSGYSSYTKSYDLRNVEEYRETNEHIELFKTIQLDILISDMELFVPLEASITVKNESGVVVQQVNSSGETGIATVNLPIGNKYEISINKENFHSQEENIDVSGLVMYRDYSTEVDLSPEKVEVEIIVTDLMNNSKIKSEVRISNKDRDEVIEMEGNQTVSLRAGDRYEVEATGVQGYAFNSTTIDLSGGEDKRVNLKLQKLEKDALLTLRDILFESNSAQLSDVSYTELQRVIKLMKENPTLKVEIAAHTDDVGSSSYNKILSEKRARSVVNFLVDNQISPDRFEARGYGEASPKVSNDSEVNRAINRRVELRIIDV